MYVGDGEHYFSVGLSALRCIGDAEPRRVLDMPCGHGRVMRFLRARWPDAELVACDLDQDGAAFCARRFGAEPVGSSTDLDSLQLPGEFDLIWCGSLLTHLDEAGCAALLSLFRRSLADGGRAVVTTHGAFVADRMREGDSYQLEATEQVLRDYEATGFGYADYPFAEGYGVSVNSPEWLGKAAEQAGLRVSDFEERCWDGHHDVAALTRS
jgi:SAM-dependent methyltransferase